MIRKLLQRVFKPKSKASDTPSAAQKYTRRAHGIDKGKISAAALKTTEGLHKAGFRAFIVGGAVRDLMLGKIPKDFDMATDATPEQVRQVFRRSRIIGRRFRIVHVMFGNETIEVTTFRGSHLSDEGDAEVADSGRILRDNVFGSQEEDAERRDFSINALVLRSSHRGGVGLPPRRPRYQGAGAAHHRRPGNQVIGRTRYACCARCGFPPSSA